jgi:hypothetical protein
MAARRWRRSVAFAASGVVALAGLALVGPAAAAPNQYAPSIGFAAGNPLTGSVATAPVLVASRLCPAGTTAINAFVDSTAAGLAGAVAISSNTTDIANITTSGISFSFNLLDVAAGQGKTLVNGRYEVSIVCLPDLFGTPGSGQFDAVFTVSGGATPTSVGTTYTFDPGGNVTGTSTAIAATPPNQGKLNPPTDDITLTATVSPATTGTVQFSDQATGGTDLGAPVAVDVNGRAVLSLGSLATRPAEGGHRFRAVFTPADPVKFAGSTSPELAYQINGANQTTTTTTLSANPAVSVTKGNPLILTAAVATVPAGDPPPGTVTFLDGVQVLGQVPVAAGTATLTVRPASAGTLTLRARFDPTDPVTFAGSTSTPDLTYLVSEPLSEGPFLGLLQVTSRNEKGREGQGTADQPINLTSAEACPTGSTLNTLRIAGPGEWKPGFEMASTGFFGAPKGQISTSDSVATVALQNGLTIVPGAYFITVTCRVSTFEPGIGFFVGQLWFYDGSNWLNEDPAKVGIPTVTGLELSPAGRADLAAEVTLTAVVTPVGSPGKVVFLGKSDVGDVDLGTVDLTDGKATVRTTTLVLGLYYVTATYQPSADTHRPSTSAEVVYVIAPPLPPLPKSGATVTGTAAPGRTVTCTASFTGALVVLYQWVRDDTLITGQTKAGYRVAASDAGHLLRCRAQAFNKGGTVYRDSPAVRVGR